ncbi:Sodium/potassium/calcium exchanger 4, partial [Eschrichtius robustus]|nr:Sodium/potassium/calcium exchanger 4 [Eschrichtius robustus]
MRPPVVEKAPPPQPSLLPSELQIAGRWEGLVLIILYVFYILIMKYNVKMQAFFTVKQKTIANGNTVNSELEDGNDYCDSSSDDPSMPLLGQGDLSTNHGFVLNIVKEEPQYSRNPVVMVDEVMSSSPPKFTFPEAGLRIMITNKFGPRTRLRMASRIIINERQRLINSANGVSSKPLQNGRHESIENGNVPVESPAELQREREQPPPAPEPELVEAAFLSPFSMPVPWLLHIASSRHITSQVHVGLRTGAAVTSGVSVPQDLDTRCQGGLEYGHREEDASIVRETAYLAGESD